MKKLALLVLTVVAIVATVYLVKIDRDLKTMIDRQTGTNATLGHIHEQLHEFEGRLPAAPAPTQ